MKPVFIFVMHDSKTLFQIPIPSPYIASRVLAQSYDVWSIFTNWFNFTTSLCDTTMTVTG